MKNKRNIHRFHVYKGVTIYRNFEPGFKLRWSSWGLAADTLVGIKLLISENLKGQE